MLAHSFWQLFLASHTLDERGYPLSAGSSGCGEQNAVNDKPCHKEDNDSNEKCFLS